MSLPEPQERKAGRLELLAVEQRAGRRADRGHTGRRGHTAFPETLRDDLMFGTPEQVIARLWHYERLGVDHYCHGASFGLPHDLAMRSLELVGRDVMRHFPRTAAPPR